MARACAGSLFSSVSARLGAWEAGGAACSRCERGELEALVAFLVGQR